jgi:DNA primase large subunit
MHGSKSERPIDTIKPQQISSVEVQKSQSSNSIDQIKVSQLLMAEGFTQAQADSLILLISQAVEESMKNMVQSLALKNDHQLVMQHNQAEFDKLQSDINDLGKKDFAILKAELEKITAEIDVLKNSVREDLSKAHGSVRLDISLEEARIRTEGKALEEDIQAAEAKIEKEIQLISDRIDHINKSTRSQVIKVLAGCFGIYTLYKSGTWAHHIFKSV